MGRVRGISPKNKTDRPVSEHRMDPLSEVFGSVKIQDAIYKRLEAAAPWGVRYSGLNKIEVTPSNPCWIFWQQKSLSPGYLHRV
jgi:hypothetical protein